MISSHGLRPRVREVATLAPPVVATLEKCAPGHTVPLARAPLGPGAPDLTADEWDGLFEAVRVRLEHAVAALPDAAADDAAAQAALHECVEALGQLQVLRRPEHEHCLRLELQLFDLRSALALALNELVDVAERAATAGAPIPATQR
jgi:hypothetical protein